MEGVEILAEYTEGGVSMTLSIVACVAAVVGFVLMLCGVRADNEAIAVIGIVAILSSVIIAIAVEVVAEQEHTRYKVAISDDVKLVEFLERYEILDTEGG